MKLLQLSLRDLRRAVAIKQQVERLEKKLAKLLVESPPPTATKKHRKMSKAARIKIGAAQRARWATVKNGK